MNLRRRTYALDESVRQRTAHIGRALRLDKEQASKLIGLFLANQKLEKFKAAIEKKMPFLGRKMPAAKLYSYLGNVFA